MSKRDCINSVMSIRLVAFWVMIANLPLISLAENIEPAKADILPDVFSVYEKCSFAVTVYPKKILQKGDRIEVQLPNSFTNDLVSPSKVKKWQTEDPNNSRSKFCEHRPDRVNLP